MAENEAGVETAVTPTPASEGAPQTPPAQNPAPAPAPNPAPTTPKAEEDEGLMTKGKDAEAKPFTLDGLKPVGDDTEVDQETAQQVAKISQKLGLSQEQFTNLYNELMPALNQRMDDQVAEVGKQFIQQAKADKDIGGANWNETLRLGRSVINRFMPEDVREIFAASQLDRHPSMIRMFRDIGRAISEDSTVRGAAARNPRDAAKAFFNNSDMN